MKVLFIFDQDSSDRPESAMIVALRGMGVDPVVVCSPGTPFESDLKRAGVAIYPVKFRHKIDFRAMVQIRKVLKEHAFDIVHVFHKKALINYTLAAFGHKVPTVAYRGIIGNLSYLDPFSWLSFLNPRIKRIICVCEAVREYFLRKRFLFFFSLFNPKKVVTIHKGHEISWYTQTKKPDFAQLDIPDDAYVVGCIARLKARKGIVELIRSLEHIQTDRPVYLLLMGRVEDKRIPKEIEKSSLKERIRLLGFRKDARVLAGGLDCIVLPSLRREGLPRAIIEAMSQGIPAVVTDSGGSPELVRDQVDGRVVVPGSPSSIAEGIGWVLSDQDRHQMLSENAKSRIKEDFTVSKTARMTLALYEQVIDKKECKNG